MRILVVSDSHGDAFQLIEAVKREKPDLLLHLGDGIRDLLKVLALFPELPLESVRGNCDWGDGPAEQTLEILGHKILMLHGHTRGVKKSLMEARAAARGEGAKILLFGHTHRAMHGREDGLLMLNPGAAGAGRFSTYGVLELTEDAVSSRLERVD